jgi:hypothetical protein
MHLDQKTRIPLETQTLSHTRTHTCTHMHTHTQIQLDKQTHLHTQTHTCTHTKTHMHTLTRTRTPHTQSYAPTHGGKATVATLLFL